MSAKMMYDKTFNGDPAHIQALHELFPADVEVGARKQRHRSTARA